MNRSFMNNAGLLLLAIVFSVGLMFAFVELSWLTDHRKLCNPQR